MNYQTLYITNETYDHFLESYSGNKYRLSVLGLHIVSSGSLIRLVSVDGRQSKILLVLTSYHYRNDGITYTSLEVN